MYTEHFGLKILPFENVPDPVFFFNQGDYARVRYRIADSFRAGRGLIVVTGPVGSGKTTLSQMMKFDFSGNVRLIWIAEPPGNSIDLFLFIARELGLKPSTSEKVFVIGDIRNALLKINSEGGKCLMIIDESHLMTDDVMNGIRLLNNLEEGSHKLIQILLLGQEELMKIINKPEMGPFKQRIASLEILGKMDGDRIRKYILHRIQVAGGSPSIFSDTALEALVLASATEGVPRIINSLCDRSLNVAFEKEKTTIDIDDIYEASERLGLQKEVFHYKMALKIKQVAFSGENDTAKGPEALGRETVRSTVREPDETKDRQPEPSRPAEKISRIGFSKCDIDRKGSKMPILLLLVSIITFISSIIFYYHRSDSSNPMTCLRALLGL